jgi:HEAT repeat protein
MRQAPSLEVPALIEAAEGSNQMVACAALASLSEFPKQAEAIVPFLLKEALKSPNGVIRHSAANALRRIDPETARMAGVN